MIIRHTILNACEVWPIDHVQLRHAPATREPFSSDLAGRVDALWQQMQAANPRLRGGPIWAVAHHEPTGDLAVRTDEYKHMTVAGNLPTGVLGLGVTGLLIRHEIEPHAADSHAARYLMGKRAPDTRTYGSTWETAPRGSVEAPSALGRTPPLPDLLATLAQEAAEELGPTFPWPPVRPVALVLDRAAASLDVVFAGHLPHDTKASLPGSWEYGGLVWASLPEIRDLRLSPPTQALFHAMADETPRV